MIDESYQTLTQPIIQRSETDPAHLALVFIEDDGREHAISSAGFHREVVLYARALQASGVEANDLVILVLQHTPTLLYAFWGAIYLGAIASVFPYLTEKLDPEIYLEQVKALVTHSQARAVITFPEFKDDLSRLLAQTGVKVLSTAEVPQELPALPDGPVFPSFSADKIAFLQHSSGTTGLQKGVALSHRSVLNQIRAYSQAIGLNAQDVVVSWLPLYHDMGLIAGFVMPLVCGVPLVLMSPFKWVRDPKSLMQAIHKHHGSLCWLPNFAYNHSARAIRPRDLHGLDLSSMRAFINCSEPVWMESQQVFINKFSPYGLREAALSSCYAMAENTFAVTQYPIGQNPPVDWVSRRALQERGMANPDRPDLEVSTPMVSCGYPIPGTQICVLDQLGQRTPDRRVGEIALRSDCMLSGYYRRPDITAQAMRDGWYLTGDMGYMTGGQLYITGRKKDLIIVGGKNIYPQDLEAIANTMPGIVPGRSVAFGLFDHSLGSENVVMICELENSLSAEDEKLQIEMELRRRIVQRSEVALADIRLVNRRWLIKTSSGKISRPANREKYLQQLNGNE